MSSLSLNTAETITRQMIHQASQLATKYANCETDEDRLAWSAEADRMLDFMTGVEDSSLKGTAVTLYFVMAYWNSLPYAFRSRFRNSFWVYAKHKTGKEQSTIDNHIRAVRTFLVDKVQPSGRQVKIPKRDENKQIVAGEDAWQNGEVREWNPASIPIAKMIAATSRANNGTMDEKLWALMADPDCNWETFQLAIQGKGGGGDDGSMSFWMAGPYLFAREGKQEAFLADTSIPHDAVEGNAYSLRARALKRILVMLGVKMDEMETAEEALARHGLKNIPHKGLDSPNGT